VARPDIFLEKTTPIGAFAITPKRIRTKPQYGRYVLYGMNAKYSNLTRDQFESVRYQVSSGGLSADITLMGDIPNLGDLQKRYSYEIKDLQRR
jgi:hypothetical protein